MVVASTIFDRQELLQRLDGDHALVREFLALFFDNMPESMMNMHDALRANDYGVLRREAHSTKSSALLLGAHALADAARRVEQAAAQANASDMVEGLAVLSCALATFEGMVRAQGLLA